MNLTNYSINGITNDPMKNNKSALLLLSLLVIATTGCQQEPTPVYNGPFGLQMGMTAEQARAVTKVLGSNDRRHIMLVERPPRPIIGFDELSLKFGKEAGLCEIYTAVEMPADTQDLAIRARFEELTRLLAQRYGAPSVAIDQAVDDERKQVLVSQWLASQGASLEGALEAVLTVGRRDVDPISIGLSISGPGSEQCQQEQREGTNDAS
ncbi:hypothetical protein [Pseudomonas spelaei]